MEDAYLKMPEEIRRFIDSDDFFAFLDEYAKKFDMYDDNEKYIEFDYLLQDLAVKFIEPADQNELKNIIKERLKMADEFAGQLAYHIWSKYMFMVRNIWRRVEEKKEKKVISEKPETIEEIIKKVKEIRREKSPLRVLNLQKVIPPKEKPQPIIEEPVKEEIEEKEETLNVPHQISVKISEESPSFLEEIGKEEKKIVSEEIPKKDKNKKGDVLDLSNL